MVEYQKIKMQGKKRIALISHDSLKSSLIEWCEFNKELLSKHELYATGTTGEMIETIVGLDIIKLKSGPAGGDQQVGARIAENKIDVVIFFLDPMESHVHDSDIRALLRIACVYNVPIVCNRSSSDFLISSPLMDVKYERFVVDYNKEREKEISSLIEETEQVINPSKETT